jgi:hypothetical protein
MRRILVDNARHRQALQHAAGDKLPLSAIAPHAPEPDACLLALDEALSRLEAEHSDAAALVRLRYFAGLTLPQAAQALDLPPRSADRLWTKLLDNSTSDHRPAIAQTLAHWQTDPDLASLRGNAIDALPEPEQAAWKKLWSDVNSLLARAQLPTLPDQVFAR